MGASSSRRSVGEFEGEDSVNRGLLPCLRLTGGGCPGTYPSSPSASQLVSFKKHSEGPRSPPYSKVVIAAEQHVPLSVSQQISVDIPRTFSALPSGRHGSWGWQALHSTEKEAAAVKERQAVLRRVLLSHEWRSMGMQSSSRSGNDSESCTYVQGVNLLAAMCLGFVGCREEDTFWLLQHLVEDVLGRGFFAKSPPLQKYHGDKTAAANLVSTEAPRVTSILGPQILADAVSMLAARFFLSGFVGCLSPGPLLAFWEELLSNIYDTYPRFPLLRWFAGLICHCEDDLIEIARTASEAEIGPLFFRQVQETGRKLPQNWQPSIEISFARMEELKQISMDASSEYLQIYEAQQARDLHAKTVTEALSRTSTSLFDIMQSAQQLTASSR